MREMRSSVSAARRSIRQRARMIPNAFPVRAKWPSRPRATAIARAQIRPMTARCEVVDTVMLVLNEAAAVAAALIRVTVHQHAEPRFPPSCSTNSYCRAAPPGGLEIRAQCEQITRRGNCRWPCLVVTQAEAERFSSLQYLRLPFVYSAFARGVTRRRGVDREAWKQRYETTRINLVSISTGPTLLFSSRSRIAGSDANLRSQPGGRRKVGPVDIDTKFTVNLVSISTGPTLRRPPRLAPPGFRIGSRDTAAQAGGVRGRRKVGPAASTPN